MDEVWIIGEYELIGEVICCLSIFIGNDYLGWKWENWELNECAEWNIVIIERKMGNWRQVKDREIGVSLATFRDRLRIHY